MTFNGNDGKRVSRSHYWLMFMANVIAVLVLAFVAVAAALNAEWGIAIIAFLLIAPVGIYFRVVMMRRCRAVGWPPALPWITFGLSMVASAMNFQSMGEDASAVFTSLGFSWLVGMADFVLMILLGVIRDRPQVNYREVFGGDPAMGEPPVHSRTAPRMPSDFSAPRPSVATGDSDAMDDAIARALDNYRRTGSAVSNAPQAGAAIARPVPDRAASSAVQPPRHAGFGRKGV